VLQTATAVRARAGRPLRVVAAGVCALLLLGGSVPAQAQTVSFAGVQAAQITQRGVQFESSPGSDTHDDEGFPTFAILRMAARLCSTSSSVVTQFDTLIRIAVRPCHCVPPHQQVPSRCTS
jgi:hypothetical protein